MTATITVNDGTNRTTTPLLILGYETAYASRSVVTDLLNGDLAVSILAPRPRNGVLELLYQTEASAFTAVSLHRVATTFTLIETTTPSIGMTYVLDGDLAVRLDDATRLVWVVSVTYQEVVP